MDTKILSQPLEGFCGQTCIALLKNISVEDVVKHTKCGKNNLYIWLEYFLGVIIKAYKELEDRVGCIEKTKGSKSERIGRAIEGKIGYFTKN